MSLRISLNNKRIDGAYGGGNQFAAGLEKYLTGRGHQVFRDLVPDLDVILILSSRKMGITAYSVEEAAKYIQQYPNTVMVLRVNTLDEQRGSDLGDNQAMLATAPLVDHIVYVSDFARQVFHKHGIDPTKPDSVILNAADTAIFNPQGRSEWQPGEKMKVVTHHWSSNYMKGFDIYERMDMLCGMEPYCDLFEFTFIGNLSMSVDFQHTRCLPVMAGMELAHALKQQHVYLSAARHEPGGNHYIEGVQCGLPVLFLETGSLREYCGEYGIGFTLVDFEAKLMLMREQYGRLFAKAQQAPHTAERMSRAYEDLLLMLVAERRTHPKPNPAPQSDFSIARAAGLPRRIAGRLRRAAKILLYG